jgi:hypothetical protein
MLRHKYNQGRYVGCYGQQSDPLMNTKKIPSLNAFTKPNNLFSNWGFGHGHFD